MEHVDHIIVGHGLAGATLAVELKRRGLNVVVVDRDVADTSSKIAAGLMTSVTGKRFALTPDWDELWPEATEFYQRIERQAQKSFLRMGPSVRLFKDEAEREWCERRIDMLSGHVEDLVPSIASSLFRADCGGIQLKQAGRLNVAALLLELQCLLGSNFCSAQVSYEDCDIVNDVVRLRRLNLSADHITFCEGYMPEPNPWFPDIVFEAAKGEMLTIRCEQLTEQRTIHANGLWLAPFKENLFRVGATYNWDTLDNKPTAEAKESLLERLTVFLNAKIKVVDHRAAVRPVVSGRQPIAGVSRESSNVGIINGLGSKGSLLAPTVARLYADVITQGATMPPKYCVHAR